MPRDYRVGDLIDRRYAVVEPLGRDGLDAVYLVLDTARQRRTQLWVAPDGRYRVRRQRRGALDATAASPAPRAPAPRSTVPLSERLTIIDPTLSQPRTPPAPPSLLDEEDGYEELTTESPMLLTRTKAAATAPTKPVSLPEPRERSYTPFAGDPFARPLSADEALALLPRTTPTRRPPAPAPPVVAPVIVAEQTGASELLARPHAQRRRTFVVGVAVGLLVGAVPALVALLL